MFQTAFPFGYLIQLVLFAAGVVVALVLIAYGGENRASRRAGLVLAGVLAMLVGLALAQPSVDDWTPDFAPEVIIGHWVADDGRSLDLRPDGTFTQREGATVTTGVYELEIEMGHLFLRDSTGRLLPTPPNVFCHAVVAHDGEYRIVHESLDPDAWDQWMGYHRVPAAKVPETRAIPNP